MADARWTSDRSYEVGNEPHAESDAVPSYHDLHITTAKIPRTAIFNLPYGYELTCTRVGGWRLWGPREEELANQIGPFPALAPTGPALIAGEYDSGLRLDVAGHVICDSLTKRHTAR